MIESKQYGNLNQLNQSLDTTYPSELLPDYINRNQDFAIFSNPDALESVEESVQSRQNQSIKLNALAQQSISLQ